MILPLRSASPTWRNRNVVDAPQWPSVSSIKIQDHHLFLAPTAPQHHGRTQTNLRDINSTRESSSGQAKLERPMEMPAQAAGSGAWLLSCISTLASCLLGFLLYFYAPWWGVRRVPGPPALPLVGHLPLLARHGPDVFALLADKYGPIFRFHLGRQPLVIVADPELCKEVGIRQFKSIPNRSSPSPIAGSALHQRGLFFTRDARWSAMRNTIVSLYQPSHLAGLIPTMQRCIERAAEAIPAAAGQEHGDGDFDFSDLALKLATDVIGQAAFGVDFALSAPPDDGGEAAEFIAEHVHSTTSLKMDLSASLSIVLGLVAPALQEPARRLLRQVPGTADWKIARANERLRARVDEIVARRDRHREERRGQRDFLSALLNARDGSDKMRELLTPEYVGALTYEHLLAGSTTTSFTLSSAVYLVAGHPEVEAKLLAEVDQSGPRSAVPTADDLQHKFPYLDQVIMEVMRFYMVSPLIAREVSQRVEVGGYVLPKGTWLWLAPGVLARDAAQFPDPGEFRPERFEAGCEERRRRHPYAHIPFGLGPRACVGQRFSLQEVKLAMVHLYRRYVFRRSPQMESPPEFQFGMVLSFRHGVKLRAIERCSSD